MGIFGQDHSLQIGTTNVAMTAESGLVHAKWTLYFDSKPVDSAAAAGNFTLRGVLGDGSEVRAEVFQSLLGPTEVEIVHLGEPIARFTGFVA